MIKNLIFVFLFLSTGLFATNDTVTLSSEIKEVTVFFKGAQVLREAPFEVEKGQIVFVINKLPYGINEKSIRIDGINQLDILSVNIKASKKLDKTFTQKTIEEKIEKQKFKIKALNYKKDVFAREHKLLLENQRLGSPESGTKISEIKLAADYYRIRLDDIYKNLLSLEEEILKETDILKDLNKELNALVNLQIKPYSEAIITIDAKTKIKSNLRLSYFINSAGWVPYYDLKVEEVNQPLSIVYNANVYQSTSEDWNNILLTLSTNNPSLSGVKPNFETWFIHKEYPYKKVKIELEQNETAIQANGSGAIKGKVLDSETGEAIPFANVIVQQNGNQMGGGVSDFDGNYTIKPISAGRYTVKASYVGYNTLEINDVIVNNDKIRFLDLEMYASTQEIEEINVVAYSVPLIDKDNVTTGGTITFDEISRMPGRSAESVASSVGGVRSVRGAREDGTSYYMNGQKTGKYSISQKARNSNYIPTDTKQNISNLEYKIEIPYSVKSNGEDYQIKIKKAEVPVDYVYYSFPRLDYDAFLTANILNWSELDLLKGEANIFHKGTLKGNSELDLSSTNDTLNISLGRDKNIVVEREIIKEVRDKKILGNTIKETIGWKIKVRNNKSVPVTIIIEDQYPISQLKAYETEIIDAADAKIDKDTGKVSWEVEMQANEKKEFTFKYTAKYPHYARVSLDN